MSTLERVTFECARCDGTIDRSTHPRTCPHCQAKKADRCQLCDRPTYIGAARCPDHADPAATGRPTAMLPPAGGHRRHPARIRQPRRPQPDARARRLFVPGRRRHARRRRPDALHPRRGPRRGHRSHRPRQGGGRGRRRAGRAPGHDRRRLRPGLQPHVAGSLVASDGAASIEVVAFARGQYGAAVSVTSVDRDSARAVAVEMAEEQRARLSRAEPVERAVTDALRRIRD